MDEIREADVEFKKTLGVKWIKGPSGHTYLCPVDALAKLNNPTEDQLKMICVDESENPQND
ncbi:MAG: hypothetical protein PVG92_01830 [Holophagae bacterium]|jgi:hypothetical protein